MPISVLGLDGNPWEASRDMDASSNNVITTYHKLSFSGSYVSGGDTVDLTSIAAQIPTGALPLIITYEANGPASSASGGGAYYQFALGSALNNNKMKAFAAGGSEQSASSYSSLNITTDIVTLTITWRKFA